MSPSSEDPIIRVVLTREIVYQGPASWVRQTLSRRIITPTIMGVRQGVLQIVSARDLRASNELGVDPELETAARVARKLEAKR